MNFEKVESQLLTFIGVYYLIMELTDSISHSFISPGIPRKTSADLSRQDPETNDDHALMARIATGDESAFRELIERHQALVIGTITKMLGNDQDSDDIAQRSFLQVWKNAKRYRPDAKFTTYLFTIVRNLVFNETRRRSRKKTISSDLVL